MKQEKSVANISHKCHWSRDGKKTLIFYKIFASRFTSLLVTRVISFPNANKKCTSIRHC